MSKIVEVFLLVVAFSLCCHPQRSQEFSTARTEDGAIFAQNFKRERRSKFTIFRSFTRLRTRRGSLGMSGGGDDTGKVTAGTTDDEGTWNGASHIGKPAQWQADYEAAKSAAADVTEKDWAEINGVDHTKGKWNRQRPKRDYNSQRSQGNSGRDMFRKISTAKRNETEVTLKFEAERLGIGHDGPFIHEVFSDTQAMKLGVRSGWRIVLVNNKEVSLEKEELKKRLEILKAVGKPFTITFVKPKLMPSEVRAEMLKELPCRNKGTCQSSDLDSEAEVEDSTPSTSSTSSTSGTSSSSSSDSTSESSTSSSKNKPRKHRRRRRRRRRRSHNTSSSAKAPPVEYMDEGLVYGCAFRLFCHYPGNDVGSVIRKLNAFLYDVIIERKLMTIESTFPKDGMLLNLTTQLLGNLRLQLNEKGEYYSTTNNPEIALNKANLALDKAFEDAEKHLEANGGSSDEKPGFEDPILWTHKENVARTEKLNKERRERVEKDIENNIRDKQKKKDVKEEEEYQKNEESVRLYLENLEKAERQDELLRNKEATSPQTLSKQGVGRERNNIGSTSAEKPSGILITRNNTLNQRANHELNAQVVVTKHTEVSSLKSNSLEGQDEKNQLNIGDKPLSIVEALREAKSKLGPSQSAVKIAILAAKQKDLQSSKRTIEQQVQKFFPEMKTASGCPKHIEPLHLNFPKIPINALELAYLRNQKDLARTTAYLVDGRDLEELKREAAYMDYEKQKNIKSKMPLEDQFPDLKKGVISLALKRHKNSFEKARSMLCDPSQVEGLKLELIARTEIERIKKTQKSVFEEKLGSKSDVESEDIESKQRREAIEQRKEMMAKFNWLNQTHHPLAPSGEKIGIETREGDEVLLPRKTYADLQKEKKEANKAKSGQETPSTKEAVVTRHPRYDVKDKSNVCAFSPPIFDQPTDMPTEDEDIKGSLQNAKRGNLVDIRRGIEDDTADTATDAVFQGQDHRSLGSGGVNKKKLALIFEYFDNNEDGIWGYDEMKEWFFSTQGIKIPESRFTELCKRLGNEHVGIGFSQMCELYKNLDINEHYEKVLAAMKDMGYLANSGAMQLNQRLAVEKLDEAESQGAIALQLRFSFLSENVPLESYVLLFHNQQLVGKGSVLPFGNKGSYSEIFVDVRLLKSLTRSDEAKTPMHLSLRTKLDREKGLKDGQLQYQGDIDVVSLVLDLMDSHHEVVMHNMQTNTLGSKKTMGVRVLRCGFVVPEVGTYSVVSKRKKQITGYEGKSVESKVATFIERESFPQGLTTDKDNTLWLLDSVEAGKGTEIVRFSRQGERSYVVLPEELEKCRGIAIDSHGVIYVSKMISVLRIEIDDELTVGDDGRPQLKAKSVKEIYGVAALGLAVNENDDIFAMDSHDGHVKKMTAEGKWELASPPLYEMRRKNDREVFCPWGIAFDNVGRIVAASIDRVLRFKPTRDATIEVLGDKSHLNRTYNKEPKFTKHGAIIRQAGVAVVPSGEIIVTDSLRHAVWKIGNDEKMLTLAGKPPKGPEFSRGRDDGFAYNATFNEPGDVAVGRNGRIYFCDMKNHRIRKIRMKTQSGILANEEDEMSDELHFVDGYDKSKMRLNEFAYMLRRDKKEKEETWFRKMKRRKKMQKERILTGQVDLPDEIVHKSLPIKPRGLVEYNEELERVEIYESRIEKKGRRMPVPE